MKYLSIMALVLLASCYSKTSETTGLEGKPLPSFSLLLADSTTLLDTRNIPSGQPIAVFLFGPNCPYSKAQMKEIVTNITELRNIQFYVITPYPFQQMKEFYKNFNLSKYPNITTGVDTGNFFGQYIGASGVPYLAIYDRKKQLRKAFLGETDIKTIIKTANN